MTDRLANVKAFYVAMCFDGIAARKHLGHERLPWDVDFVHMTVMPALFRAIKTDDPAYDPHAVVVEGKPDTEATSTAAVRWFVELMESNKAFQALIDEHSDLYVRLYKSSHRDGCFLDDLVAALRRDDPEWRGPQP
ncbi:hypothetical protein [Nocardia concava]|uniref:hypothetical protein n=1 Tax=Nocardia concava TaxID=257281 RepID=UPI0005944381|nr:hypothetical protein [Nocardia concava]